MTASSESVTFRDAVGNVEVLDELILSDDQPTIEAQPLPLVYRVNFDTNFEDRNAFITGISKYIEEATRHGEFNDMLAEGFQHAAHLYTWRCCSRAVPMAKSNDQPNRVEMNEKIVEVLNPEVSKLHRFMHFTHRAVARFCDEIRRLCHPEKRKDFVSESYLLILGKFLNMFAILDELKNMKASIKNDFSTFRRSAQFLQVMSDTQTIHEMQKLSMFLATQNKIKEMLRAELLKTECYEELLADVVNICALLFESHMYITPADKHMFVKVLGFALYLIDGDTANVLKLDQRKRISIAKLDKIFKVNFVFLDGIFQSLEIVPLFGDMQIQPFSFVKKSAFYDSSKWPLSHTEAQQCHVNVIDRVRQIREHHTDYVTHISRLNNELAVYDKDGPRTDTENRDISELALRGIQLLCSWTSDILETVSWKLLHPTDPRQTRDCPEDAEEYERATRYNYTMDEKAALIEIISMIKGLQLLLGKMDLEFSTAIRRHVYAELQDFVQITLKDPHHKAVKAKKDLLAGIIQSVCDTCVDHCSGMYDSRSSDMSGGSKSKKKHPPSGSAGDVRTQRRTVAPSTTQLYMARTMLESLVSERCGNRRTLRKDIDSKPLLAIQNFLRMSYFWPSLLQFSATLADCCDLSQLWFREFYLEMTMGKRIQFPIEMSVPWILTDHILTITTHDPSLIECLLYQLDLYNDAAHYSLSRFRKQFLYDEVEAEVNLCFDQFVFKLSDAVFTYYKQLSSTMLLDKKFKADCAAIGVSIRTPPCSRYDSLLRQRHVQLLGRSIDLNRLISQRINMSIQKTLDVAISRFESRELPAIVELEKALEANRLCHRLLREQLNGLSDFDDLLLEANHAVSAPYGRITAHVFWELNYEFLPNYCYNGSTNRFVRSKTILRKSPQRDKPPSATLAYFWGSKSLNAAFQNIFSLYDGFIGMQHLKSIARLLGYQGIAVVLEELIKLSRNMLNGSLRDHVRALFSLMPKVCKLPRYDYGSPGVLQYYLHHLVNMRGYSELKRGLYQVLREFGNVILFCLQLELALGQEEVMDLLHAAPFQNVIPKPAAKKLEEQELKMKRLEQRYSEIQIAAVVEKFGNAKQGALAREADLLTRERLCCGLNIFEMVLNRLRDVLNADTIWTGGMPTNGVMWVDECVEFHRVWSAIQFVYCQPPSDLPDGLSNGEAMNGIAGPPKNALIEETFGDGLNWAGCTLIALLGQQRRFEILDFCYHLLRVHRSDGKDECVEGIKLSRMVDRIRRFQLLNQQIFTILGNYTPQQAGGQASGVEHIRLFAPPVHHSLQQSPPGDV